MSSCAEKKAIVSPLCQTGSIVPFAQCSAAPGSIFHSLANHLAWIGEEPLAAELSRTLEAIAAPSRAMQVPVRRSGGRTSRDLSSVTGGLTFASPDAPTLFWRSRR